MVFVPSSEVYVGVQAATSKNKNINSLTKKYLSVNFCLLGKDASLIKH